VEEVVDVSLLLPCSLFVLLVWSFEREARRVDVISLLPRPIKATVSTMRRVAMKATFMLVITIASASSIADIGVTLPLHQEY
jgi:hypothetical protein